MNEQALIKKRYINHTQAPFMNSSPYLCYPLCTIINICIEQGVFPNSMKHAEIVPIFKKGEKMEKSNYRPVSILSCLSS